LLELRIAAIVNGLIQAGFRVPQLQPNC